MFTVRVERTFTASHQLTMAGGTKEPFHSHDWVVRVAVGAQELDEAGLGVDFIELQALVDKAIEPFSGKKLEEMACFSGMNASAENLTKYIYTAIEGQLEPRLNLEYVEVMESKGCWTKYRR